MTYEAKWINKFLLKPKKWVFVPSKQSKIIGKNICRLLRKHWDPPEYFYHLRNGGHVEALRAHEQNQYFSRLDIDNFFGSITRSRITRSLKKFVSYKTAWDIAHQSTVKDPDCISMRFMLPFGFIQSPLLASICLDQSFLGEFLKLLNKNPQLSLSVYMDDLVISSNDRDLLLSISADLKNAIVKSHWSSNEQKEDICKQLIMAFNIEISHQSTRISDPRMQEFKYSYKHAANSNSKLGIVNYIRSVNPVQGLNFLRSK
ncbi:MAG: hypothetical protein B7X60_00790 [Polynucleobacter sp. 39-45-136]|jgi:hypothetical protein|nr:MAG: hypothetical protein B7X60_00790 [Polynucleobacter sp. 39-45-136]